MSSSDLSSFLAVAILLVLQAFITATTFALNNASRKLLKERAESMPKRWHQTIRLMDDEDDHLLTLQQYLSICFGMLAVAILTATFANRLSEQLKHLNINDTWGNVVAILVIAPLTAWLFLLVGYQLPVTAVSGRVEGLALFATPILSSWLYLLNPLLHLTLRLTQSLGVQLGGSGRVTYVTEEEIKTLVKDGAEEGSIEAEEELMIYSVFKFGDTLVREVMVPRIDMIAIELHTTWEVTLDTIIKAGHSRIPVYEETIDNIKGILYAKDLLVYWRERRADYNLANLLRKPYFVPESKKADELLEEFRIRETHIAIVNDEYGGTAGLVTLEDLLEQIVGDIRDEYDLYEEAAYEMLDDDTYICMAWIDLDDLNEMLDISLPTDDNDTLGGYIFSQMGKVPKIGDKVAAQGYEFEVLTLKGERRIYQVRVARLKPETDIPPTDENLADSTN